VVRSSLLIVVLAAGCGGEGGDPPPDGAPEPVGQGSEASEDLAINELSPAGEWVELANRSDAPVDLAGWFATDLLDRLDHYQPLSGTLAPGELVVVELVEFGLGPADEVHLVEVDGRPGDGLAYLAIDLSAGESLGRVPSGEGLFFVIGETPGESN
jgi:hypothetical protein